MPSRASGTICPQPPGEDVDVLDAVVDEENLPAAVQLPHHRVADQLALEARHAGLHGQPVLRRRLQVGDVAQAQQAHVQRPRDGRGRHRQHVDDLAERLQPLLHLDAEPLLLVDDHQPQVVEPHVRLHQPVGADDDVDRPLGDAIDGPRLLPARGEPRQGRDLEGKLRHPRRKGPQVLLGQHGGRHQHGHLVAGVDGLERRPHRHSPSCRSPRRRRAGGPSAATGPCRA